MTKLAHRSQGADERLIEGSRGYSSTPSSRNDGRLSIPPSFTAQDLVWHSTAVVHLDLREVGKKCREQQYHVSLDVYLGIRDLHFCLHRVGMHTQVIIIYNVAVSSSCASRSSVRPPPTRARYGLIEPDIACVSDVLVMCG
jgi:hypothetical protein